MTRTDGKKADCAPWAESFRVDDGENGGGIRLRQTGCKEFVLESKLEYLGRTGLEDKNLSENVMAAITLLDPTQLPAEERKTDLASVPSAASWFLRSYGAYTPAALIHDRLIPAAESGLEGLTDQHADRYFRFMLESVGVSWLKRWVMWSAVATRTRLKSKGWGRTGVVIWAIAIILALAAMTSGIVVGNLSLMLVSALAPIVLMGLWGKQWGAGLALALAVPWLLPPTIIAALGHGASAGFEYVTELIYTHRGSARMRPRPGVGGRPR